MSLEELERALGIRYQRSDGIGDPATEDGQLFIAFALVALVKEIQQLRKTLDGDAHTLAHMMIATEMIAQHLEERS